MRDARGFGRRLRKSVAQAILTVFLILNLLAYISAYGLTHYVTPGQLGLGLPKPSNAGAPADVGLAHITQRIPITSQEWLETWFIAANPAASRGTVLLFPGNGGSKAKQLLAPAQVLHGLNYNLLMVDFRGVGGSSGTTTTLGVREAKDVALAVNFAEQSNLQRPYVLYGVSMGSAAILRAIAHEGVTPDAIILELPFARLLDAVRSRLRAVRVPTFPLAELIVFWGSVQHGFNGFFHNPVTDAKAVKCPTLILQGSLDRWTTEAEVNQILQHLSGPKQLVLFPNTGHSLLVTVDKDYWRQSIDQFLQQFSIAVRRF